MRLLIIFAGLFFMVLSGYSQHEDTLMQVKNKVRPAQIYLIDSQKYIYPKPQLHTFLTNIPRTFGNVAKESFRKESIKPWLVIAGSTALLWAFDQKITDGVQHFSKTINLDNSRRYIDVVGFKLGKTNIDVYQAPDNLNTAIYTIGEGMPAVLISVGLLTHGIIKQNNRSLSTASQVTQGLLAMGITTQFLKRVTGRQSPFNATKDRGDWNLFTNPRVYQNHVSNYDAFPSGHMATMMTTTVILAENYPEKKWIRPVGYSLMAVVGLSMINNGVHWASDYPLAIGMGYVFGKVTVKMNRWIKNEYKGR